MYKVAPLLYLHLAAFWVHITHAPSVGIHLGEIRMITIHLDHLRMNSIIIQDIFSWFSQISFLDNLQL